jgi:hypothetical protein
MKKEIRRVTHREAAQLDDQYWEQKTPQEKLSALTRLRVQFHGGKRLVKVISRIPYDR